MKLLQRPPLAPPSLQQSFPEFMALRVGALVGARVGALVGARVGALVGSVVGFNVLVRLTPSVMIPWWPYAWCCALFAASSGWTVGLLALPHPLPFCAQAVGLAGSSLRLVEGFVAITNSETGQWVFPGQENTRRSLFPGTQVHENVDSVPFAAQFVMS